MKRQQLSDNEVEKSIYEQIRDSSIKKFSNQYKIKFKKQYSQSNIYTVICSIGVINKNTNDIQIIGIANGTKSLPYSIYQQHKTLLLKDMHAQILVIKAFRKFINQQINKPQSKYFVCDEKYNKKAFNQNQYALFLYSSEPFCGDCSVDQQQGLFSGGKPLTYFDSISLPDQKFQRHVLRTKPGRLDLPQNKRSLSLSCSDKLALYNIIGIQGKSLFEKMKPVYINNFIVECKKSQKERIEVGLDFIKRLSQLKNYQQSLIQRKIFSIVINSKERKISHQFKPNKPQIICLENQQQKISQENHEIKLKFNKKQQKQGFQLSLIELNDYFEWINSKTGLPQGSSLKNFTNKGKISTFSKKKLQQNIQSYKVNNNQVSTKQTFKYTTLKERIKLLFGIWTDTFKSKTQVPK